MSLFAKRDISATHQRPDTTPDSTTEFTPLGTVRIHVPIETEDVPHTEIDLSARTAEFTVFFDPVKDVRAGDRLDFLGFQHEVTSVRRPGLRKRFDVAEADVVRKEIPA
jgi:hypothetical protein